MQDFKASDYPTVYKELKINTGNLGCIMLDTEGIVVSDIIPAESLFYSEKEDSYTQGIVSENVPHATLLYGLLQSGQLWSEQVDTVLDGWTADNLVIDHVGFFYSNDPAEDYITIIAELEVTGNLLEAHKRLSLLPHINTFPNYTPHITLAYVKATSPWKDYVSKLSDRLDGESIRVERLNYGDK